ncbi:hypothetical protein GmHk_12G034151 [Glycine max]|nr:hypothetical protein GmHk_12G034151 [Glycine max]
MVREVGVNRCYVQGSRTFKIIDIVMHDWKYRSNVQHPDVRNQRALAHSHFTVTVLWAKW